MKKKYLVSFAMENVIPLQKKKKREKKLTSRLLTELLNSGGKKNLLGELVNIKAHHSLLHTTDHVKSFPVISRA